MLYAQYSADLFVTVFYGILDPVSGTLTYCNAGHNPPYLVLVLYSDGITEAQNAQQAFFGEGRLLEVLQAKLGHPAKGVQNAVLAEVHTFVGDAPQFDDMTLMVVVRDLEEAQVDD